MGIVSNIFAVLCVNSVISTMASVQGASPQSNDVTTATTSSNVTTATAATAQEIGYGIDVSFPIHHSVSTNYPWLPHHTNSSATVPRRYQNMPLQVLGNRQELYNNHLRGCRNAYPGPDNRCDEFEYDRLLMNRRQPQSMQNYTQRGFLKVRAPETVISRIQRFWRDNHFRGIPENWHYGNSYVNHWDAPTYLVSVDDKALRGSGRNLKEHIWAAASATLEEWTSQELQPCSMYGIRVYSTGAIMMPHVDRLPLVASAIISVAQDVDEPWPFEMYDHDGIAHNVTLEPGEMMLFESHSVIHGHSFPLRGSFAAYIFIHFEPTGRPLHQDASGRFYYDRDLDQKYREIVKGGYGGPSSHGDGRLPPYITRQSPEELHWKESHPAGWFPPNEILPPGAHVYAKTGELSKLKEELKHENSSSVLTERDEKGWQILHQGVASGNVEVVELLVHHGADLNARTHGGYGETPLRIAEKEWGMQHPVVMYLKGLGALSLGPEL